MRLVAGVFLGILGLSTLALARGPADSFRRSIRIFTRPIPSFQSDSQATGWYRASAVDRVRRSEDGSWRFSAVVFLAQPLEDFEVQLVFYDVSDGRRDFVRNTAAMVGDRNARVIKKNLVLCTPEFNPRRYYEVVATRRREEVTRASRFFLGGEVDTGPQEVEFTDEETQNRPPDLGM